MHNNLTERFDWSLLLLYWLIISPMSLQSIAEENEVQLKSYTKTMTGVEAEKNSINVSKMVARTPSPKSKRNNKEKKQHAANGIQFKRIFKLLLVLLSQLQLFRCQAFHGLLSYKNGYYKNN